MTSSTGQAHGESAGLSELLDHLKRNRGFDFSGYKLASLERRIAKRMAAVEVDGYGDYLDLLQVNPDELAELFDTILINVTCFYRDKPAWDYVASEVVPAIVEATAPAEPIRVWSAGCASGEEPYTIAMILIEALGEEEFKRRVKIYATDADEDALASARQAVYPREALKALPEGYAERYFEPVGGGMAFRGDLRRHVIFGRNNLLQDAPISRIDLLVSRNTLMYFNADAQAEVVGRFNFALNDTGYLFLGKSEMLLTHGELFSPHNLKLRVFKKVPRVGLRERLAFVGEAATGGTFDGDGDRHGELRRAALDNTPVAHLVVDRGGFVTAANQRARAMFAIGAADVGRPLQDLDVSYRPADLRSALESAYDLRDRVRLSRVSWQTPDDARVLDIEVTPLATRDGTLLGAGISFDDVTAIAQLDTEHHRAKQQLEAAYEELQSTVEELETTNEELHSTNEELETTNEELQSTNEELETMNEELRSTNDELEAMNDEQNRRSDEMDRLNLVLESILGSLGIGVIVLDGDGRVQIWNASATELWGLRGDEVMGEKLVSLDIGLPIEQLEDDLRAVLTSGEQARVKTVEAMTRRGRTIECWVKLQPLRAASGESYGAILLMTDAQAAPLGVLPTEPDAAPAAG
jgi:two-component system, chemotaxis family, CheB/CheR fusion protein